MADKFEENERKVDLKTAIINGRTVYVIEDAEEAEALIRVARDRLFMEEAQRRLRKYLWVGGSVIGFLIALASWWPWISHIVSFLIKGVPSG